MFSKSSSAWWLIDCDCFFVSCERKLDPSLEDRVVCVGQDIIIARSYEAKQYGISVWTPVREAKKTLPSNTIYLPPRIHEYKKISQDLMTYLKKKCNEIEVFSIDEAFFDITWFNKIYGRSYENIVLTLKQDIKKDIWIPVSIWLAPTKILAKMFADIKKPYGEVVALEDSIIDSHLKKISLWDIPFIWRKTQKKISHLCQTAYDFKLLSYAYVRQLLWKSWIKLRHELNSISTTTFKHNTQQKVIWRTRSFNPHFTAIKSDVWKHLYKNIKRAVDQLHRTKLKTKHIHISFRTKSFKRFWFSKELPYATNDRIHLIKIIRELFENAPFDGVIYRTTWVSFSELHPAQYIQNSLFWPEQKNTEARRKLDTTVHILQEKYGRGVIL